jgi:hypothetical protein
MDRTAFEQKEKCSELESLIHNPLMHFLMAFRRGKTVSQLGIRILNQNSEFCLYRIPEHGIYTSIPFPHVPE